MAPQARLTLFSFVARRLLQSLGVLLGVSVIVFALLHLTGDPTRLLLPLEAREEDVRQLRALLGLDDPLWMQYVRFLSRAVRGDFGLSFKHQVPALTLIAQTLPATLELTAAGLGLALVVAVPAGILAALKRNSVLDAVCSVGVLLGQAMPVYWLGLLLIMVFAVGLGWFPAAGRDGLASLVLPATALGAFSMARIARMARSGMLEVLAQDYVRTARAARHGRLRGARSAARAVGSGQADADEAPAPADVAGAWPARAPARHRSPRPRHPEPSPLRRPHLARRRPHRGDALGAARRDARPPRRLLRRPRRHPHHAHRGRLPRHSLHPARHGRRLRARPQPAHRDPGDGRHPLGALRAGGACRRALDPRARVRGGRARPWQPRAAAPAAPRAPERAHPDHRDDDPRAGLHDHLRISAVRPRAPRPAGDCHAGLDALRWPQLPGDGVVAGDASGTRHHADRAGREPPR